MKAKDYAEIYKSMPDEREAIGKIGAKFLNETAELLKSRKIKQPSALNGVLQEQKNKWIAFCRQTGGVIKEDGYEIIVRDVMPELGRYF